MTAEALTAFRRALHMNPEVSGAEAATARRIADALEQAGADQVLTGLGGHGVAGLWRGEGPRVMLRAELDALPIRETGTSAWRSVTDGVAHLCGHDGHTTFLVGVAQRLSRRPLGPEVVLMFQPAEETGEGAAAVARDPRYAQIRPDYAFAIHNMPGMELGHYATQSGPMACASCGLAITLTGRTAHASEPHKGLSPDAALVALIPALKTLSRGDERDPDFALVTVTHARLGTPAFGIAPGEAELFVTLRSASDEGLELLRTAANAHVRAVAQAHGLHAQIEEKEPFRACMNTPGAVDLVHMAAQACGIPQGHMALPMRPSEDFAGLGGDGTELAMIYLGAGDHAPRLHAPDYDFPDALLPTGIALLEALLSVVAAQSS